jgi:hypothetical protein
VQHGPGGKVSAVSEEHAISYKLLERGTKVVSSDGQHLGIVARVLENPREHIFDGIVIDTAAGERFVDAPEIGRITNLTVSLTIDADAANQLPEPDPGAPEYQANPGAGRLGRLFGGNWRKRR